MPSPFTWDTTKPAGGDAISIGDDQIRTDKATIRDVLRTLIPFGTASLGWRAIQIDNDTYLVHNAKYDGTNWSHDDTSVNAKGIRITSAGLNVDVVYRVAAASTWTVWGVSAKFVGVGAGTNNLQLLASAAAAAVQLLAEGGDANIDILLAPKGTGRARGASAILGSSSGATQLAADNTTRFLAPSGIDTPGTAENEHRISTGADITVLGANGRLNEATPGGTATRTLTLLKNGVATAIVLAFGSADSTKTISAQSVAFSKGDFMSWESTAANTPAASRIELGVEYKTA